MGKQVWPFLYLLSLLTAWTPETIGGEVLMGQTLQENFWLKVGMAKALRRPSHGKQQEEESRVEKRVSRLCVS